MKNYYTYVHLIDGKPIYVGEGTRKHSRAYDFRRSPEHEKLLIEGDVDVVIVGDHGDKVSAELNEQGLISWIGLPNLLNKKPYQKAGFASYGFAGKKHTDEWKKQQSERPRPPCSDEKREKIRKANTGFVVPQERKDRIRASQLKKLSEKVECPHCHKRGAPNHFLNHHFDNCNLHPDNIEDWINQCIDDQLKKKYTQKREYCEHCKKDYGLTSYKKYHGDHCKENPNYVPNPNSLYTCPHCGEVGRSKGAMSRSHFDNCKHKP